MSSPGQEDSGFPRERSGERPRLAKKGKVLHLIDSGGLYGAEKVILALGAEMRKASVFEPVVGCIVGEVTEESALHEAALAAGIEVRKIVIRNRLFPRDLFRLAGWLQKEGISLIHSHGYKPSVFGFLLSRCTGIPITATCHLWYKSQKRPLKYKAMTRLELIFYRFFKQVVAVSDPIKQQLVAGGVDGGKVLVVRNGVDAALLQPERREKRMVILEGPQGGDRFIILNVARLTPQKAQKRIVEAAEILKGCGRQVCFCLVGEGEARGDLEKLVAEKQLHEEVRLFGFRADAVEMMDSADLFILPSMDEGLPISMLEAMARKLPVLATPVGEIPKLVEHGKTGLLVAKNDAADLAAKIAWAMDRPAAMERMAEEAFGLVTRHYTSEAMFLVYEKVYKSFIFGNGSGLGWEGGQSEQ
jgi:glycosyltransferase involved in cell wall biosynthesis